MTTHHLRLPAVAALLVLFLALAASPQDLAKCWFQYAWKLRTTASRVWYLNESTRGFVAVQFGGSGDTPVTADYDGDGKSDVAVYRSGVWYILRSSTAAFDAIAFGAAGDVPAPADFDGDARADVAVFRPATGYWYEQLSGGGSAAVRHGMPGDVPVAADYDGDGRADVNVFRASTGTWYRINSGSGAFAAVQFRSVGDRP